MWPEAQGPCGLGKLLPVLTSPSSEDIFPKYRHSLKIASLSILPTNEDNSEEILGKTVDCFPSPPTLPLTRLVMSQAQNWLSAFLCDLWIQTRPRPYIGQVDTRMSSEVTGAQRIEGASIFEISKISGFFFPVHHITWIYNQSIVFPTYGDFYERKWGNGSESTFGPMWFLLSFFGLLFL